MIKPRVINVINKELTEYGGLAFSLPEIGFDKYTRIVSKYHLCSDCWKLFILWIEKKVNNKTNT